MFGYRKGIRWRKAKDRAKIRDDYQCVRCGSKKNLQVHHIVADPKLAYVLSNLQTLCIDCHNLEQK
jgi:5-methylcytosine-specific restriction enzyme A